MKSNSVIQWSHLRRLISRANEAFVITAVATILICSGCSGSKPEKEKSAKNANPGKENLNTVSPKQNAPSSQTTTPKKQNSKPAYAELKKLPDHPPNQYKWAQHQKLKYRFRYEMNSLENDEIITGELALQQGKIDDTPIDFGESRKDIEDEPVAQDPNEAWRYNCFFIHPDGLAITRYDSVRNGRKFIYYDGEEVPATVLATDPISDLALLQIDRKRTSYLPLGDPSEVAPADEVFASTIYYDQPTDSYRPNFLAGAVSGFIKLKSGGSATQLDISMNRSHNGSPIVDVYGNAIGINIGRTGRMALQTPRIVNLAKQAGITLPLTKRPATPLSSAERSKRIIAAVCPVVVRPPVGTEFSFQYSLQSEIDGKKEKVMNDKGIVAFDETGKMTRNEPYAVPYFLLSPVDTCAELFHPVIKEKFRIYQYHIVGTPVDNVDVIPEDLPQNQERFGGRFGVSKAKMIRSIRTSAMYAIKDDLYQLKSDKDGLVTYEVIRRLKRPPSFPPGSRYMSGKLTGTIVFDKQKGVLKESRFSGSISTIVTTERLDFDVSIESWLDTE